MINLSPSKINTYKQCPFKYKCEIDTELRKKYRRETPPLVFGNLIHACLNDLYKRTQKEDRSLQRLRDLFEQKFKANLTKHINIFGSQENIISYVEKAKKMFKNYTESEFFEPEPMLTEEFPKCLINENIELRGKFDRVDLNKNKLTLIDYKTGKFKQDEADKFQVSFYELLLSRYLPKYTVEEKILYYLGDNKIIRFPSEKDSLSETEKKLISIANKIDGDKELLPTQNNLCRYCDYKVICPALK